MSTQVSNPLHPTPSQPALQGDRKKVAFITGAGQGIGRAIAIRIAQDGFDIAINDVNSTSLSETKAAAEVHGGRVLVLVGDVSNESRVAEMIENVVSELGYLDVMIANAGICITKTFMDSTSKDWERIYRVNVEGVRLCYQYAAKHFIKQGTGGKLLSASSTAGLQAYPLLSAYSASKFAIRSMNQAVATELADFGITANCYAPGQIETDMMNEIEKMTSEHLQQEANLVSRIPLKRKGTSEDVANVVSFLASRSSDYITGQTIPVDGGFKMF